MPVIMKFKLFFIFYIFTVSCASADGRIPERFSAKSSKYKTIVEFYGSHGCGHCQYFSAKMQEDGIAFVFYDVNNNSEYNKQFWKLVKSVKPNADSVTFPVLVVAKKVLVTPTYEEFKKVMEKSG